MAELGKKQIEQTIQQLQEQLQLNLIQQTHILQSADKKKASGSLQQLALQQQQLIQQLQLMQRQYVVHQGMGMQPLMLAQGPGRRIYEKNADSLHSRRARIYFMFVVFLLYLQKVKENCIKVNNKSHACFLI